MDNDKVIITYIVEIVCTEAGEGGMGGARDCLQWLQSWHVQLMPSNA